MYEHSVNEGKEHKAINVTGSQTIKNVVLKKEELKDFSKYYRKPVHGSLMGSLLPVRGRTTES